MNFSNAKFVKAAGTAEQLPPSQCPEVAFAGRSNVGKSSLINKVLNRKGLVKVSSQPGKTTTINFFSVDKTMFVDLPGYGYAKVSRAERERWSRLIDGYFDQDRRFALVVSLVDIRHDASDLDVRMVSFLRERELPFVVVATKADKLSKQQQQRQVAALKRQLGFEEDDVMIATSVTKSQGIEELKKRIAKACS